MKISIVGTGSAENEYLLPIAKKIIENADLIIGAKRLTDGLCGNNNKAKILNLISPKDIFESIVGSGCESAAVLMSGDTGFYSGTRGLMQYLEGYDVEVIPAVSSVQLLSAAIKKPWQNWKLSSAHGVDADIYSIVKRNKESFFLTGGKWTINEICRYLREKGMGGLKIYIGEDLGTEKEKVSFGNIADLAENEFSSLAVCLIENENPCTYAARSIKDEDFIRGKIPMTKEEVRTIVISKLNLKHDDIVYDVGAGTGSVSVETALRLKEGHVYAVEREEEGIELIKANAEKHGAYNLTAVHGEAPEALENLPRPDAVFIGGSGGNMEEILNIVFSKNPEARIVITAVSLETLTESIEMLKKFKLQNDEIVQICVNRSKLLGRYHMLMAQNPIFILSGNGAKNQKE